MSFVKTLKSQNFVRTHQHLIYQAFIPKPAPRKAAVTKWGLNFTINNSNLPCKSRWLQRPIESPDTEAIKKILLNCDNFCGQHYQGEIN